MEEVSQSLSGCHRKGKSSSRGDKCSMAFSDVTHWEDDDGGGEDDGEGGG